MDYIEDSCHNKWSKYGGAFLCIQQPYDDIVVSKSELRHLLIKNKCWFARWTSDFDCNHETSWWYCLKDMQVNLDEMNAKQRYRIRRGLKNIRFLLITQEIFEQYEHDIWETCKQSFVKYPEKYRPTLNRKGQMAWYLANCKSNSLWGGICVEDNHLCCLAVLSVCGGVVNMKQLKTHPDYLNKEVNAGFAYSICEYYLNRGGYKYIVDGERNIRHETKYQDFLIANLGFRKAYCKLNIVYHPLAGMAVKLLYPFRNLLKLFSNKSSLIYNIYCVLKQEECRINCK